MAEITPIGKLMDFGFYPRELDITQGSISISTLPGLADCIDHIKHEPNLRNDWIYPGNAKTRIFAGELRNEPFSARIFSLPKTHSIEHRTAGDGAQIKFHVWTLSFFLGMRLTTEEAGFLDSTPIKPGKLTDFIVQGNIAPALELADKFWTNNSSNRRQTDRLCAAIHALFVTQNPQYLDFESFIYLYTSLDACFKILNEAQSGSTPRHAERLDWMCNRLNIPTPAWASPNLSNSTEVSILRNDAIHEALFIGEPLGFKSEGIGEDRNLNLEMRNLTCRVLAAILGLSDRSYLSAPIDDRQYHPARLV